MNDLPPATHFRPLHLKLMMAGLRTAWKSGALPPPDLDADRLRAMAEQSTGLTDDPGRDFFDRQLAVLLGALEHEAQLSRFGRLIAQGSLLKVMRERLQFAHILAEHPEIDRLDLAPPVVIVGPMRSGTTRLQRLLACDPGFTALRLYEASCPVPSPAALRARDTGRPDPRIAATRRILWFLASINPAIQHAHPTGPLEVDEELGLLEQSLTGATIEAQRRVPTFARHCEQQDQTPAYVHMLRLLKLRTWFTRTDPAQPYILKTPQHMQDLAALHAIFPDARLIFLHRDPVETVASGASLVWNQMVIQSDTVDPHWIGEEWLHKTAWRMKITRRVRQQIPAHLQMDASFSEMNADWRGTMKRIYAFLDRELTPEILTAMSAWMANSHENHGFHRHRYRLESFGLTESAVRARIPA
ncbi:MAG: sulfotransferase [Sphingomonadaceae bacterium]